MNAWPISFFTCGCFAGIHQHHAVLVEQALVALDEDHEVAAVLEREPGAAVGERVGVHADAVLSVGPMPEPVSRYHAPLALAMSTPATFHSASSAACVPLLSPREANGACAVRDLLAAPRRCPCCRRPSPDRTSARPARSRCTSPRSAVTPKPSARNFSSAAWSCTNTTSASPRRPMSSAWPVPTRHDAHLRCRSSSSNTGSRCLNRPDCSVEVVEATVMNCPARARAARRAQRHAASSEDQAASGPWQFSFDERGRFRRGGLREEIGRPARARRAARRWRKRISSPRRRAWPRLCVVMTILVPAASNASMIALDLARRAGIEARGRLVEEQHLAVAAPRRARARGAAARRRRARAPAGRRDATRPDALERGAARAARARRGRRRRPRARSRRWRAPSGAASPGAGTPSPARRGAPALDAGPAHCARRSARAGRASGASARSCRRRWRPRIDRARRRRRSRSDTPSMIVRPPTRRTRRSRSVERQHRAQPWLPLRRFLDRRRRRRSARARSRSARCPGRARAAGRPCDVSSAMVVVITRVTPSMLPPTIITAPTSAAARPKPGEHDGDQREAQVPEQRQAARRRTCRRRASAAAPRTRATRPRRPGAQARR